MNKLKKSSEVRLALWYKEFFAVQPLIRATILTQPIGISVPQYLFPATKPKKNSHSYDPSVLGDHEPILNFVVLSWPYLYWGHFLPSLPKTTCFIALKWSFFYSKLPEEQVSSGEAPYRRVFGLYKVISIKYCC